MPLSCTCARTADGVVVLLEGTVDASNRHHVTDALRVARLIAPGGRVIVDVTALEVRSDEGGCELAGSIVL